MEFSKNCYWVLLIWCFTVLDETVLRVDNTCRFHNRVTNILFHQMNERVRINIINVGS